jgi:hypothetical protein
VLIRSWCRGWPPAGDIGIGGTGRPAAAAVAAAEDEDREELEPPSMPWPAEDDAEGDDRPVSFDGPATGGRSTSVASQPSATESSGDWPADGPADDDAEWSIEVREATSELSGVEPSTDCEPGALADEPEYNGRGGARVEYVDPRLLAKPEGEG